MADMREKLVELIGTTQYGNRSYIGQNFQQGFIEKIADHLISNGVTIQRWIPVTERLPKGGNGEVVAENVVACLNNGEVIEQVCTGWCNGDVWWLIVGDDDTHTAWGLGAVTHWMPLPEAPGDCHGLRPRNDGEVAGDG